MEPRAAGMGMDSERGPGCAGAARGRDEVTPTKALCTSQPRSGWFLGPSYAFPVKNSLISTPA